MTASSGKDTGQVWPSNNPEEQMLPGALTCGIHLGKVPFVLMFKRLDISFLSSMSSSVHFVCPVGRIWQWQRAVSVSVSDTKHHRLNQMCVQSVGGCLLYDQITPPLNHSIICWIHNRPGFFRVTQSGVVASRWLTDQRVLVKGANKNKKAVFLMRDEGRDNQFLQSLHVQLACPFCKEWLVLYFLKTLCILQHKRSEHWLLLQVFYFIILLFLTSYVQKKINEKNQ